MDENICLSDQLCETYDETKVELVESVDFILKNPSENNPMKVENGMEPIDCIQVWSLNEGIITYCIKWSSSTSCMYSSVILLTGKYLGKCVYYI